MLQVPTGSIGGARLALTAALSHFPEVEPKLELHGPRHNADLTESQLDAHWGRTRRASNSMLSSVLSSDSRNSPNDSGK
jgi:hypothetical protein